MYDQWPTDYCPWSYEANSDSLQAVDDVDIETHEPYKATVERSDPTALPAAGVVMEAVVATVLAQEILEKFSSDNLEELKEAVAKHREYTKNY